MRHLPHRNSHLLTVAMNLEPRFAQRMYERCQSRIGPLWFRLPGGWRGSASFCGSDCADRVGSSEPLRSVCVFVAAFAVLCAAWFATVGLLFGETQSFRSIEVDPRSPGHVGSVYGAIAQRRSMRRSWVKRPSRNLLTLKAARRLASERLDALAPPQRISNRCEMATHLLPNSDSGTIGPKI